MSRSISYLPSVANVPSPGAFSRATIDNGLVYVSGTGAGRNDVGDSRVKHSDATVADRGPKEEAYQALENVSRILKAAGSDPSQIVSVQMLISNKNDYDECNLGYRDYFNSNWR